MSEPWEKEIGFGHRWGRYEREASDQLVRLRELWERAQPMDQASRTIIEQIIALEICNWRLENSILALCEAIGRRQPSTHGIGHAASMTYDRWMIIWGYYLACREWLPADETRTGYRAMLKLCDPQQQVQHHVSHLLGERTKLKELYVERFCLLLEHWIGGYYEEGSSQIVSHRAGVRAVEREIESLDNDNRILGAMRNDDGKLQPCHHKVFRRYDILLSSIGAGGWRAAIPMRGSDGFDRADTLDEYLVPIENWISGNEVGSVDLSRRIHRFLGEPDGQKVFMASLLASLLRSQQRAAREKAERRK